MAGVGRSLREGTPVPAPPQTGRVGTRLPKYDTADVVLNWASGRKPALL